MTTDHFLVLLYMYNSDLRQEQEKDIFSLSRTPSNLPGQYYVLRALVHHVGSG